MSNRGGADERRAGIKGKRTAINDWGTPEWGRSGEHKGPHEKALAVPKKGVPGETGLQPPQNPRDRTSDEKTKYLAGREGRARSASTAVIREAKMNEDDIWGP